jgi:hypothetical protein
MWFQPPTGNSIKTVLVSGGCPSSTLLHLHMITHTVNIYPELVLIGGAPGWSWILTWTWTSDLIVKLSLICFWLDLVTLQPGDIRNWTEDW